MFASLLHSMLILSLLNSGEDTLAPSSPSCCVLLCFATLLPVYSVNYFSLNSQGWSATYSRQPANTTRCIRESESNSKNVLSCVAFVIQCRLQEREKKEDDILLAFVTQSRLIVYYFQQRTAKTTWKQQMKQQEVRSTTTIKFARNSSRAPLFRIRDNIDFGFPYVA